MDTPQVDPQGQPAVEPQSDPVVADTGQPPNDEPVVDFPNLRNEDGTLNEERVISNLKERDKFVGQQTNELGQLRLANTDWAVYREGEQARMDAAVANVTPSASSDTTNFEELLEERWETDKTGFVRELLVAAEDGAVKRMTAQQRAFDDPMLDKHPDVKREAQGLMAERGLDVADAIDMAVGRKARGAVNSGGGGTDFDTPAIPPTTSRHETSSFIAARGTSTNVVPDPKTELTADEKRMADDTDMTYEEYAKWRL